MTRLLSSLGSRAFEEAPSPSLPLQAWGEGDVLSPTEPPKDIRGSSGLFPFFSSVVGEGDVVEHFDPCGGGGGFLPPGKVYS